MRKIYASNKVAERIEAIVISEGGDTPSYKDTLTSPKYKTATYMGCLLSMF